MDVAFSVQETSKLVSSLEALRNDSRAEEFLSAGEMVIEYAGELIRSTLTDKRERYYDSKGIGCYMFKIDDNLVVDATMSGTAARFINHSCDVSFSRDSRIIEIR